MRFHKIRLISGEINPTQTSKLQDFALYLIWRNKPIVLRLFDLISLRAPQPMVGVHQVQTAERRCWERQVDKMWGKECPWNRLRDFESTVIHWNWVKIIGIYHQSKGGGTWCCVVNKSNMLLTNVLPSYTSRTTSLLVKDKSVFIIRCLDVPPQCDHSTKPVRVKNTALRMCVTVCDSDDELRFFLQPSTESPACWGLKMINNVDKMNINCVCGSVQEHLVTAV